MRTALISDIHGNREALEACLAHARAEGVDRYVFLGDFVGYGADPGFVVDTVARMTAEGAVALLGNHDAAIAEGDETMNAVARAAIAWTRGALTDEQRAFLSDRPYTHRDGDILFVHATPARPEDWGYILDPDDATLALGATDARIVLCGHTHLPIVFRARGPRVTGALIPDPQHPVPIGAPARWLAVLGACGQPRDRNPLACYGLLDEAEDTLTYVRLEYDVGTAARKILDAGLPPFLAERLLAGR